MTLLLVFILGSLCSTIRPSKAWYSTRFVLEGIHLILILLYCVSGFWAEYFVVKISTPNEQSNLVSVLCMLIWRIGNACEVYMGGDGFMLYRWDEQDMFADATCIIESLFFCHFRFLKSLCLSTFTCVDGEFNKFWEIKIKIHHIWIALI